VEELIGRIQKKLSETEYTSAAGYCYEGNGKKSISEMLKKSDEKMYAEKAKYYSNTKTDRRRR
jgi:hypothetical protein